MLWTYADLFQGVTLRNADNVAASTLIQNQPYLAVKTAVWKTFLTTGINLYDNL
jgi:hypothetical protein